MPSNFFLVKFSGKSVVFSDKATSRNSNTNTNERQPKAPNGEMKDANDQQEENCTIAILGKIGSRLSKTLCTMQ